MKIAIKKTIIELENLSEMDREVKDGDILLYTKSTDEFPDYEPFILLNSRLEPMELLSLTSFKLASVSRFQNHDTLKNFYYLDKFQWEKYLKSVVKKSKNGGN